MTCGRSYEICSAVLGGGTPVNMAVQSGSLAHTVQTQAIIESRLLGVGMNEPELITFEDGSSGIWKRWAGSESIAEVFACEFADRAGLTGLVPETVFYEDRPGTVQRFVDAPVGLELDDMETVMVSEAGQRIALFDYLTAQGDRHEGNWLYQDGRVIAIDNGNAFFNKQTRSPFYAFHRGKPIPGPVLDALKKIEKSYLDESFDLLSPGSFILSGSYYADQMWQRLQKCIERKIIP